MGEPFTDQNEIHTSHRSFASPKSEEEYYRHNHDSGINGDEEPYTIKCICGFDDDAFDGATVFCEQCNTWQHIACYYSPNTTLAPDAEHSCIDCKPYQRVDPDAATLHQKALRLPHSLGEDRKGKRTSTKSHRKSKTRDLNNNAVHVNGYAIPDGQSHSPSTGSPRDSAPPTKKPKTSHRPSASITNGHNNRSTNGRHRSSSNLIQPLPPPPPLDQCPQSYLSPEFIRVHRENTDFNRATANLHLNISVTNLLSTWLDDQDAFFEATHGKTHGEVFKHFPQPIEELETPIRKEVHTEPNVRFHGAVPQWPFLTVDQDLLGGEFVGEIRGCIGRREDYQSDPANQWHKLRHPDHFVFFHPHLPIYLDARQEGSILRYARRSCRPNLQMETIITGAREYRFCFTASRDIPSGTEITIAWDTKFDTKLQNALSRASTMSSEDRLYISDFFETNLAHFGGCACQNQGADGSCLLANFDHRAYRGLPNGVASDSKGKRKRIGKRPFAQTSTNGSNSRESSEEAPVGNHDGDVDMLDGRSTTQSTKSSRDATPSNNHRSDVNGLSERDKKKLAQQEKLFEQMEQDRQPSGQKKKKRSSGSNANTPIVASHRQAGRVPFSTSNPATPVSGSRPAFAPPNRSPNNRSPSASNAGRSIQQKHTPQPVRPIYVDASTQTLPETAELHPIPQVPKKVLPRSKQLLRRSLFQSRLHKEMQFEKETSRSSPGPSTPSPTDSQAMDTDSSSSHSPSTADNSAHENQTSIIPPGEATDAPNGSMQKESADINMPDADTITATTNSAGEAPDYFGNIVPFAPRDTNPIEPVKPPPPPWPTIITKAEGSSEPSPLVAPVAPMATSTPQVDFVKPTVPNTSPPPRLPDEKGDLPPGASESAARPLALTVPANPARTPEAESITKPSPVKKKMSLSDYMSKRNKSSIAADKTPTPGTQGSPPAFASVSDANRTQSPLSGADDLKG